MCTLLSGISFKISSKTYTVYTAYNKAFLVNGDEYFIIYIFNKNSIYYNEPLTIISLS